MNTPMRLCIAAAIAAATAALLTACGGGSDPDPLPTMPTQTVPDSATASVAAYVSYISKLIADVKDSESAQPLLLNAADAPSSETAAPQPVN